MAGTVIFRLENEIGEGIYKPKCPYVGDLYWKHGWAQRQPSPYDDFCGIESTNWKSAHARFGFLSVAQLTRWFPWNVRQKLKKLYGPGFSIAIYETSVVIASSAHQCVFNVKHSQKLASVPLDASEPYIKQELQSVYGSQGFTA
jgi:hypothetical protein